MRVPDDVHAVILERADAAGMTITGYVRMILEAHTLEDRAIAAIAAFIDTARANPEILTMLLAVVQVPDLLRQLRTLKR
jgi:hypothetical protein